MERTVNFFQNYSTTKETEQEREPYEHYESSATVSTNVSSNVSNGPRRVMENNNIDPETNSQGYAIYREKLKKTIDSGVKKQTWILIIICLQFLITVGVVVFLAVFRK